MLIKICGLTNPDTAKLAALNGADYIGLLFSARSIRQIDLETALQITNAVRQAGADVVGVFVDEDIDQIQQIITHLQLKIVQLHGDEARSAIGLINPQLQIIYVVKADEKLPNSLNPFKDFLLFEHEALAHIQEFIHTPQLDFRYFIAGGLTIDNIQAKINQYQPNGVDLSSGVESVPRVKNIQKIIQFIELVRPDRFGKFGGVYIPELLVKPLQELADAYYSIAKSETFRNEFNTILKNYAGRPTAVTEVKNFARALGNKVRIFLKREDLLHTGAHKINNALGQCLLAKQMGKTRIIAETGAGQHGVATATACAMFGLDCVIYMGETDIKRQFPNVAKMRLLGAQVVSVTNGSATLKDAVNEALRDWAANYDNTHYCLGSALGPHPFPKMVADFHSVIGNEAKLQMLELAGVNPNVVIACVGGGSNAIGIFGAYLADPEVQLIGVEAGGYGIGFGNNAARFQEGSVGVLHGAYTYLLQDVQRQILETHSVSAGLDYAAVGPQHANLFVTSRAHYGVATDSEALNAFMLLTKTEGIIPALESAHALGYLISHINEFEQVSIILVNLSGRGDKDLPELLSKELLNV